MTGRKVLSIESIPVSFTLKERFFACRFLSWVCGRQAGRLSEGDIVYKIGCSPATYRKIRAKLFECGLVKRRKGLLNGRVVYQYKIGDLPRKPPVSQYRQKISEAVLFDASSHVVLKELNHSSLCVLMYLVVLADDLGVLPVWDAGKFAKFLGIGEASLFSHLQKIKRAGLLASYKAKRGYTVLSKMVPIRELNLNSIASHESDNTRGIYLVDFVLPGQLLAFTRLLRKLYSAQNKELKLLWELEQYESTQSVDAFLKLDVVDWLSEMSTLPSQLLLCSKSKLTKEVAADLLDSNASLIWLLFCYTGETSRKYEAYFYRCYGRLAALYVSTRKRSREVSDVMIAIACYIFQLKASDSVYAFAESSIDALQRGDQLPRLDGSVEQDLKSLPQVSRGIAVMLVDFVRLDIESVERRGASFKQSYSSFKLIDNNGTYVAIAD